MGAVCKVPFSVFVDLPLCLKTVTQVAEIVAGDDCECDTRKLVRRVIMAKR